MIEPKCIWLIELFHTIWARIRSDTLFAPRSYTCIEQSLFPTTTSLPSFENFTENIPKEYSSSSQNSKPSWISCRKRKNSKHGLHAHHLHFMSTAWLHEHAVIVSEYRTYSNISTRFPSSILHIHNVNNRRQTGIGLWRIERLEWKRNKKAYKRAWNNQNTTWLVSKQLHKKTEKVHLKE